MPSRSAKLNQQFKIVQEILKFAVPASVSSFLNLGQMSINLIFVGHLNDPVKLAAVGMGTMILNMVGVAPQMGLNSGLETLVSQAKGSGNLDLCGLYLQRGRVIVSLAFIPMMLIFALSRDILSMLGQDPEVVKDAYFYILVMSPSIFVLGLQDIQRKFMIQSGLSDQQMNTQIIVTVLHLFWTILFIKFMDLGIAGIGVASLLTNSLGLILNMYMTSCNEEIQQTCRISIFDSRVMENIMIYLKIGLPNVTILMLDWTAFEASSLMAGYLGVKEQAVNVVILNILTIVFQIPYGIQQAGCALIGQKIGAGEVQEAKELEKVLSTFSSLVNCIELIIFYFVRDKMILIFTNQESLLRITDQCILVILIVIAMDFQQGALYGPLKALGQQTNAMYVNIVTYYVLVIPLSYYFAFHCKVLEGGSQPLGMLGLWFGFVVGLLHQIIMYIVLIRESDWDLASKQAKQRQQCDNELLVSTHHNNSIYSGVSMRSQCQGLDNTHQRTFDDSDNLNNSLFNRDLEISEGLNAGGLRHQRQPSFNQEIVINKEYFDSEIDDYKNLKEQ